MGHLIADVSGPGGATGFGLYLLLTGAAIVVVAAVCSWRDHRSRVWPTVVGSVRRTWIDDQGDGASVEVEVAYRVGERSYVREETVVEATSFRETREAMLRRLRPGTPVVVHHHPTRPHVSRLRTRLRWPVVMFALVGLGMAGGGVGMLAGLIG